MKINAHHLLKMAVRLSVLAILFLLTVYSLQPQVSLGNIRNGPEKKIVRVGYYLYEGYQELDEKGIRSGYGYDYLKEISQFANWHCEFVEAPFSECIKMLENGEIDIVGGIDKEVLDSNKIVYSKHPNYSSKHQLYTKPSNVDLNFDDFDEFDKLPVGIVRDDYQEKYLDEYCKENNISFDRRYYEDVPRLEQALEEDQVQAIYLYTESNERYDKVIARMEEHPLYYGVNEKSTELLEELNKSMQNIKNSNNSYDMQIQNKYYIKGNIAAPYFTDEELDYIQKKKTVKVSYDRGWQPIEYYDEKTHGVKGVTKDLFDLLEHYTGLEFEFVRADNLSQALGFVKTGDADLISLVSHDYGVSEQRGIYTSSICINAALVGVIAKDKKFEGIQQIAMPKDYYLDILQNYEIITYETVEECFEAVNAGKADATIANAYTANYYLANPKFVNLIRQDLIGYSEDLSLGVSQDEDIKLLNILNKGLHCISDMELSNIILNNYVVYEQPKFRKLYYSSPVVFLGLIVLSVFVVTGVLIYMIMLKNKVNCTNLKMIEFLNIEKDRVEHSLRAEAEKDLLTGLYNRRKIETELREFLLKISVDNQISLQMTKNLAEEVHCFMMLDLDRFKRINDKYGHPEGDILLKRVAEEFTLIAGEENLTGRLGGDEFVILFKNIAGRSEAERFGEKLQKVVRGISKESDKWNSVAVSIGVVMFGCETYSFREVYERADVALYRAKNTGRNKVVFYNDL